MSQLGDKTEVDDTFPDDHALTISQDLISWFADFVNYLDSDIVPPDMSLYQREKLMYDMKIFLGMSHTCIRVVPMDLFGVVCHKLRCYVFWMHVILHP